MTVSNPIPEPPVTWPFTPTSDAPDECRSLVDNCTIRIAYYPPNPAEGADAYVAFVRAHIDMAIAGAYERGRQSVISRGGQ